MEPTERADDMLLGEPRQEDAGEFGEGHGHGRDGAGLDDEEESPAV